MVCAPKESRDAVELQLCQRCRNDRIGGDGTADMSVPYNQSVQLQAKLKAAGVSCELITIDDGVHGMARWDAIAPAYKDRVIRWIAQKLGVARSENKYD